MTLQNRVTPFGEIVADPARGTVMGNRGVLHDDAKRLGRKRWAHKNWLVCRLEFHGRHRQVMSPGVYTELFFLDEAVAFAAGHRPCAECRNADYKRYKALWMEASGRTELTAAELDKALHAERAVPRQYCQQRHASELAAMPDGAFVTFADRPEVAWLVRGERLFPYAPSGYGAPIARPPGGRVTALTPPATQKVLAAGYRPQVHASAT